MALERTENQAAKEAAKREKEAAAGRVRIGKRSKRFWFEKHRWGILSDGRMVVGGRDAKGKIQWLGNIYALQTSTFMPIYTELHLAH
ncbi:MAG: hypothetical protein Ct9H90mP14_3800 [Methanobacteriota archaeon]|nr:MAG: hypothetical protein Ct9H90mP14_3800 [Euryarchaeota archaeon]